MVEMGEARAIPCTALPIASLPAVAKERGAGCCTRGGGGRMTRHPFVVLRNDALPSTPILKLDVALVASERMGTA